ncbi:MAG: YtxH domain-containing protein [Bryobacterales bacterium]|nr:YtxH domain-containing protein [Bryobacterales bacterium]
MQQNHNNGVLAKEITILLFGAGVGYVAGILLAPRTGNDTRGSILAKARKGREFIHQRSIELRDRASQIAGRGINTLSTRQDGVKAALDAGRRAYRREVERETAGA